jgi:signal transduction histidine kinase
MLKDLLLGERSAILELCNRRVLQAGGALAGPTSLSGWSLFYDELIEVLLDGQTVSVAEPTENTEPKDYVKLGYTISDVVQSYNIVSQSIVEAAKLLNYHLSAIERARLTVSFDKAIAIAVTEFDRAKSVASQRKETERLGFLAHELRNSLQSATIAMQLIESGSVGTNSSTGSLLQTSLQRMAELIDTALTEVRLRVEPTTLIEAVRLAHVIGEVQVTAAFQARLRQISLVTEGINELEVLVDRQLLVSALANLLQNALKFSHARSTVIIRGRHEDGRVLIEIEDECGGMPEGSAERIFAPFVQQSTDRSGVGLGLAISRTAIERCRGILSVRNLPGKGCVFAIDLPGRVIATKHDNQGRDVQKRQNR